MAKITDGQRSGRQYSTPILWISLISVLLLLAVFMESMCLGILYVNNFLKGTDTRLFAKEHLLTRPFASTPPAPIPGKHFDPCSICCRGRTSRLAFGAGHVCYL